MLGYDISTPRGNVNGHITITTILVQIAWYFFVTWCLTSAEQKVPKTLVLVTNVYIVEERGSPLGDLDRSGYRINLSKSNFRVSLHSGGENAARRILNYVRWRTIQSRYIKAHPRTGPLDLTQSWPVWLKNVNRLYNIFSQDTASEHIGLFSV